MRNYGFWATALLLLSIGLLGMRAVPKTTFKQNVSGYLKQAADANTIELAEAQLSKAINYLEANKLTEGYTSIFYNTPDEDIGFWYQNLKASQEKLTSLGTVTPLEESQILLKLRETLTDSGEKTRVTYPRGLEVYPNNGLWAVGTAGAALSFIGAMACLGYWEEQKKKLKS